MGQSAGADRSMSRTLRLHVPVVYNQFHWSLRLRDDSGLDVRADVQLDPSRAEHQELIDRPRDPVRRADAGTRARLRATLTDALGPDVVRELTAADVSEVWLRASPIARVALTLPLEVLFDDTSTIVVRQLLGTPAAPEADAVPAGVLAGFALCPEDGYLCLHEEARLLQEAAAVGSHHVDELFITFTGEQFLERGRGRAVVHLAGHGSGSAMSCPRAAGARQTLTARELIDAWSERPPGVVVLNFCESSSERDVSRLLSTVALDSVDLDAYQAGLVTAEAVSMGSFAIDLAAGLPTAVVAMRTPVHDVAARRFAATFYGALLGGGVPLVDAFRRALEADCPVDDAGVPVPTLYLSTSDVPVLGGGDQETPISRPDDRTRRYVNYLYKGFTAWAQVSDQQWMCSVTGWDSSVREHVLAHLVQVGEPDRPDGRRPLVEPASESSVFVVGGPPGENTKAVQLDLDSLPSVVPIREVTSLRPLPAASDAQLLAYATCQVPSVLEALHEVPIEAAVAALRDAASGRSPILDRSLRWDLARVLLDYLPNGARGAVLAWSEAKWARLQSFGPLGIDVAASRFLLEDDFFVSARLHEMLIPMANDRGLAIEEVGQMLIQLAGAEVASISVDAALGRYPEVISFDLLTASRAWESCSDAAVASYRSTFMDSRLSFLGLREATDSVATPELIVLAQTCLAAGDQRFWPLLDVLRRRTPASLAERLAEAASAAGLPHDGTAGDSGQGWKLVLDDLHAGRRGAARAGLNLLEPSGDGEQLSVRVARIVLQDPPDDPRRALEEAAGLIDEVLAELQDGADRQRSITWLNGLRQLSSAALELLGEDDASVAVLVEHWEEVQRFGGSSTLQLLAGGPLVERLRALSRFAEARAVLDVMLSLSADSPPSAVRCWTVALDLTLLTFEQRFSRLPATIDLLVDLLRAWDAPGADVLHRCFLALSSAELSIERGGRGIVWLALADYASGEAGSMKRAAGARGVSEVFGVTVADVVGAAPELEAALRPVLDRIPTQRPFAAFFESWLAAWEPASAVDLVVTALGAENAAALRARATAGCAFAQLAERNLARGGTPEETIQLPDGWDPASLEAVVDAHPPLRTLLANVLAERFVAVLPLVRAAHAGGADARIELFGALLGHFRAGETARPPSMRSPPSSVAARPGRSSRTSCAGFLTTGPRFKRESWPRSVCGERTPTPSSRRRRHRCARSRRRPGSRPSATRPPIRHPRMRSGGRSSPRWVLRPPSKSPITAASRRPSPRRPTDQLSRSRTPWSETFRRGSRSESPHSNAGSTPGNVTVRCARSRSSPRVRTRRNQGAAYGDARSATPA